MDSLPTMMRCMSVSAGRMMKVPEALLLDPFLYFMPAQTHQVPLGRLMTRFSLGLMLL